MQISTSSYDTVLACVMASRARDGISLGTLNSIIPSQIEFKIKSAQWHK